MDMGDLPDWIQRLPGNLRERAERFREAVVLRTVWADRDTMDGMGIYEDVMDVLKRMGLPTAAGFRYPTYPDPTRQFFISLRLDDAVNCGDGAGERTASFYLDGRRRHFSVAELGRVLGFPEDFATDFDAEDVLAAKALWRAMTGEDEYRGDAARTLKIRNPVLRYTARLVANVLFGRKDIGKTKLNELCLLHRGMPQRDLEEPRERRWPNNAYLFLSSILEYRGYVEQQNKEPTLAFGGMLVPLFIHLGIDLSRHAALEGISTMDIYHLSNYRSCSLTPEGRYLHRWTVGVASIQCLLPQPLYSPPTTQENIRFDIPVVQYFQPGRRSRARRRAAQTEAPAPQESDSDEEMPADFALPIEDPIPRPTSPADEEGKTWARYSDACHQRHSAEIGILRRMVGWLAKQNRRLADQVQRMGCRSGTDAVPRGDPGASTSRARRSHTPPSDSDRPSGSRRPRMGRSPSTHSQFSDPRYDADGNEVDS